MPYSVQNGQNDRNDVPTIEPYLNLLNSHRVRIDKVVIVNCESIATLVYRLRCLHLAVVVVWPHNTRCVQTYGRSTGVP